MLTPYPPGLAVALLGADCWRCGVCWERWPVWASWAGWRGGVAGPLPGRGEAQGTGGCSLWVMSVPAAWAGGCGVPVVACLAQSASVYRIVGVQASGDQLTFGSWPMVGDRG